MRNKKIQNLVKIPLMTVIIILCSWITLPFPVPLTLQTFGLYAALLLIGGRMGTLSLLLYILLGCVGLPVFSGFSSGAGHLISPTGGYIWGFLLCTLLYLALEKVASNSYLIKGLILFSGTLICYLSGTLWFMYTAAGQSSLYTVLTLCVLPYIIPDSLKLISAIFISKKVKPIIDKIKE